MGMWNAEWGIGNLGMGNGKWGIGNGKQKIRVGIDEFVNPAHQLFVSRDSLQFVGSD